MTIVLTSVRIELPGRLQMRKVRCLLRTKLRPRGSEFLVVIGTFGPLNFNEVVMKDRRVYRLVAFLQNPFFWLGPF